MSRIVLDTETTGTVKPCAYDVSYEIIDDNGIAIAEKHFVVEQAWHNLPLFETAYYKEKRPKYVALMRAHKAEMKKYGHIMQELKRDIKKYDVKAVFYKFVAFFKHCVTEGKFIFKSCSCILAVGKVCAYYRKF